MSRDPAQEPRIGFIISCNFNIYEHATVEEISAMLESAPAGSSSSSYDCEPESLKEIQISQSYRRGRLKYTAVKKGFAASCSSMGLPVAVDSSNWRISGVSLGSGINQIWS